MRRHAIIGALLMIGLGVILGATVFRTDIAQATGLAQSVTVSNTPAQAVPVREQNLDNGNVKVHEQGTVSVRSADKEVSVTAVGFADLTDTCGGDLYTVPAGKQLVIKYISGFGNAITGSPPTNASGIIYTATRRPTTC
jgi:ABC-type enterochelin transport system substrate-binding protein